MTSPRCEKHVRGDVFSPLSNYHYTERFLFHSPPAVISSQAEFRQHGGQLVASLQDVAAHGHGMGRSVLWLVKPLLQCHPSL